MLNSLHIKTKEYVIRDELLFDEGSEFNTFDIYETERILRSLNIFSRVHVQPKVNESSDYDINIITQDRWSFEPAILYGSGGGAYVLGAGLREYNLLGTSAYLQLDGLYRSENSIGWEGLGVYSQRRFLRTPLSLNLMLESNRIHTKQYLSLQKQYLNYYNSLSYGIDFFKSFGDIYYYKLPEESQRLRFTETKANAFFSHSWLKDDQVYFTALVQYHSVDRGDMLFRQAYDNTTKLMLSFSSVADDYIPVERLNSYLTEDLCVGGYGNAILGKTFKNNEFGEDLYYLGAQGEQSVLLGNMYLFGQISAGTSFLTNARAKYTYQEFLGIGFYSLSPKLVIAARLRQQTAWNWIALRQLILDNDAGLRGYRINEITGENRLISNWELRFFPGWELSFFKFSGVMFVDVGTAWDSDTKLYKVRWHQSAGFGLRIHNLKASANSEVIRIDFAFNLTQGKFGEIIFSSGQLFSLIKQHKYKLPEFFGLDFDHY